MKRPLLFTISIFFLAFQAKSQIVLTDSINLGEDRSSHNYQEFNPGGGSSIKLGAYECSGDSAINIGGNNENDSITFNLSVSPNTDKIVLKWRYAWFNAGTNQNEFPKIVVENSMEHDMISSAPNSIGASTVGCELDSHVIVLSGMSAYTSDGSVKIKIYDPYPSWVGNSSICRVNVYSDNGGLNLNETKSLANSFSAYPNPFTDNLVIQPDLVLNRQVTIQIVDALGKNYTVGDFKNENGAFSVNTEKLPEGLYFVFVKELGSDEVLWSQKVVKK